MNFYPFHIGDYAAHTQRLSLMEDLAYRRLMDAYYLAERPFNGSASDVAREIGMLEQIEAVTYVLGRFFNAVDGGFSNDRCDKEISHYQDKKEQASNAGKASAAKRSNARSTPVEKNATDVQPSQEPLTKNQTNTPKPPTGVEVRFEQFWKTYPRKVGKDAAMRAFAKRKPDADLLAEMLAAIGEQARSAAWVKDGGQFIPHPSTWLNEGRWQDEHGGASNEVNNFFAGAI